MAFIMISLAMLRLQFIAVLLTRWSVTLLPLHVPHSVSMLERRFASFLERPVWPHWGQLAHSVSQSTYPSVCMMLSSRLEYFSICSFISHSAVQLWHFRHSQMCTLMRCGMLETWPQASLFSSGLHIFLRVSQPLSFMMEPYWCECLTLVKLNCFSVVFCDTFM